MVEILYNLMGSYPTLNGGELLIVIGDFTSSDKPYEYIEFFIWLLDQNYKNKILISGPNNKVLNEIELFEVLPSNIKLFLCDKELPRFR